ncbi:MAG: hypothetical protein ACRDL2_12115 [Gaiellaceae bacterium]
MGFVEALFYLAARVQVLHPDPRRASAGDTKSRLVPDPDPAATIVEISEALGHGKMAYVREDALVEIIDSFFAANVFGPNRIARFQR